MPGSVSLAEHYRAHRKAFELALRLGCTPKEAERQLRAEKRARRLVCGTAAQMPTHTLEPLDHVPTEFSAWSAPWMMRD